MWCSRLRQAEGVELIASATVERVEGSGAVRALHLSDGRVVPTDYVVVGIGVDPDTGWLADSGLTAAGGVPVDPNGATGAKNVFAAIRRDRARLGGQPALRGHGPVVGPERF
jgi:NADPH-dependent 2,4-dienoyl-CoA reductase/sulfur reductase-like enzyme